MITFLWFIPLGVALGAFGTLIGAGGGFLLVPILLLLYPHQSPQLITSVSLAVVFFNAASGSLAYARMGRIDFRAALVFAAAATPGAVLGALSTAAIPRRLFDGLMGVALVVAGVYLFLSAAAVRGAHGGDPSSPATQSGSRPASESRSAEERPRLTRGQWTLGAVLSVFIGYLSSVLGIGGGIIHVPVLARVLHFPVHVATATSHMILAIMSLAGTAVHVVAGNFRHGFWQTVALSIGVVVGAQVGAWFSNMVKGDLIIRALAAALGLVGVRILLLAWSGPDG